MLNLLAAIHGVGGGVATSYESIATTTVGAGGASSIDFTSIPSTYQHLQIRLFGNANNSDIFAQFNGDTTTNYSIHYVYGDGATAAAGATASTSYINAGYYSTTSGIFGASVMDVLDYANTNKNKTIRTLSGGDANGSGLIVLYSGNWRSTSAITSIKIYPNASGTFRQYTHAALYGIRA